MIDINQVERTFEVNGRQVLALRGVTMQIARGSSMRRTMLSVR